MSVDVSILILILMNAFFMLASAKLLFLLVRVSYVLGCCKRRISGVSQIINDLEGYSALEVIIKDPGGLNE